MARPLATLVAVLSVTAALAGCFHDDKDDGGGNGNGASPSPTPTPTNTSGPGNGNGNETPPLIPPVPVFTFAMMNASGANMSAPFFGNPGENLTVLLDGSGSSDADGEIVAWSWVVSGPGAFEAKSTNETFTFNVSNLQTSSFGAYRVQFKVLDDDNVLNGTGGYFVVHYQNTLSAPSGMFGPGQGACQEDPLDRQAGNPVPPSEVAPGTYKTHSVNLAPNATTIDLTLTYQTTTTATLGMFLYEPGADPDACPTPAATADPAASPVTLVHEGNLSAGQYSIRVELNGASVDEYAVAVKVLYAAPQNAGSELGA